jgi:hypothetical protein
LLLDNQFGKDLNQFFFSIIAHVYHSLTSAVSVSARRLYSAEVIPTPGSSAAADPKITAIVDQIEGLTLLQTSELVSQLKVKKNGIGREHVTKRYI